MNHTLEDKCPVCERPYRWNSCGDHYTGTVALQTVMPEGVAPAGAGGPGPWQYEIRLAVCPHDGGVIAVIVADQHGQAVYIPSTKEL